MKKDVSVIIATYNTDYESLKYTVDSVMCQKGIDFEMIITDDGSVNNHFEIIENYMQEHGFYNYVLLPHDNNRGTVLNYLDAVRIAKGRVIRTLGAGDAIYGDESLRSHVDFLIQSGKKWSFGEMIYFTNTAEGKRYIPHRSRPQLTTPYINNRDTECVWNYCVIRDIATGTAILYERDLFLHYLELFANEVLYTEDYTAVLMTYDGYIGAYYPRPVVLYEFSTGITAPGNSAGGRLVQNDIENAMRIMVTRNNEKDRLHRQIDRIIIKRLKRGKKKTDGI